MLNFPNSPTNGQIYTGPNGVQYTWSAPYSSWLASAPPSPGTNGVWQLEIPTGTHGDTVQDVAYGNEVYVAVILNGNSAYTMTSTDGGYTWGSRSQRAVVGTSGYYSSVTFGNGNFFCVCPTSGGVKTFLSVDGITWTPGGSAGTVPNVQNYPVAAAGGGKYIVGGYYSNANMRFYHSTDGINFTLSSYAGTDVQPVGLTYSGGNSFMAVDLDGTLVRSTDGGVNWAVTADTVSPFVGIGVERAPIVYNGTYVLVANRFISEYGIYKTMDGSTVTVEIIGGPYGLVQTGDKCITNLSQGVAISSDSFDNYLVYINEYGANSTPLASNGVTLVGRGSLSTFALGVLP